MFVKRKKQKRERKRINQSKIEEKQNKNKTKKRGGSLDQAMSNNVQNCRKKNIRKEQ